MTLGELIESLASRDPNQVVKEGFTHPRSYRGYYECLAFEPAANVTVGVMLEAARSAVGKTFHGYKGGEFKMDADTDVYLASHGDLGDGISAAMFRRMLDDAQKITALEAEVARLDAETQRLRSLNAGLRRDQQDRAVATRDMEAENTRLNGLDAAQAATIRSLEAEVAELQSKVDALAYAEHDVRAAGIQIKRLTAALARTRDRLVETAALLVRLTDLDSCRNEATREAVAWLREVGHKLLEDRTEDVRAHVRRDVPAFAATDQPAFGQEEKP